MGLHEQVRRTEQIDSRTDVWAIAAVLLELVAGRTLLQGHNAKEVFAKLLLEPLLLLGTIALEGPVTLRNVLSQALERDVSKRIPRCRSCAFGSSNPRSIWGTNGKSLGGSGSIGPLVSSTLMSAAGRRV